MQQSLSIENPTLLTANSSVKDYFLLMKPRVMSLVVFTSLVGLLLAPGTIHPFIGIITILCITLGSGSAAAINMWYDRDIDALMLRTEKRPLITGALEPDEALSFGIITGTAAVILMTVCVNLMSGFLLLATILYYVFIYTIWLKRSSPQNVVIGGVAGAIPPMIGWAAVTSDIRLESLVLFMIIFLWTPPHSWALALYRLEDYQNCRVPMLPAVKGKLYTKIQILLYSILMLAGSFVPFFIGMSGILYLITSAILGIGFLYYTVMLFFDQSEKAAKKLFLYSIFYLFVVFLSLLLPS